MGRPATPETKRAVTAALLDPAETRSRAQLARDYGVATRTVSRWSRELGIDPAERFSTADTAAATKAATDRRRAKRSELADKLLDEAQLLLERLHRPWLVWNFGGKDNTYEEQLLDEAPVEAVRNVFTTAAIAIDKSIAIDRHDDQDGDQGAAEILSALGATLAGYAVELGREQAGAEQDEEA